MVSAEHQKLVNMLARALEDRRDVTIKAIDIAGTPQYFEPKYRNLPLPSAREGSIPDLEGKDANGVNHLGEAETDMDADNLDDQLKRFSGRVMNDTRATVPLHVIVPERIKLQMESRIRDIGLGDMLDSGEIGVWSARR